MMWLDLASLATSTERRGASEGAAAGLGLREEPAGGEATGAGNPTCSRPARARALQALPRWAPPPRRALEISSVSFGEKK